MLNHHGDLQTDRYIWVVSQSYIAKCGKKLLWQKIIHIRATVYEIGGRVMETYENGDAFGAFSVKFIEITGVFSTQKTTMVEDADMCNT